MFDCLWSKKNRKNSDLFENMKKLVPPNANFLSYGDLKISTYSNLSYVEKYQVNSIDT